MSHKTSEVRGLCFMDENETYFKGLDPLRSSF